MDTAKAIGERIKSVRTQRSLHQADLARLIGCKQQDVSVWECGRRLIPTKYLIKLPKALGCDLNVFDVTRDAVLTLPAKA